MKSMRLEDEFRSQVQLEPGEVIRHICRTKQNLLSWSGQIEGHVGFLVLTTRRILFYRWGQGIYELRINLNLEDIRELTSGGSFVRHLIINGHKFFPRNEKPKTFERLIRSTMENARSQVHAIESPGFPIATNQYSALVQENDPPKICKHCGFQNDEDALFCVKCGTEI